MKTPFLPVLALAATAFLGASQAAFIVEAHSSGLANGNFAFGGDTTTASASTPSAAVGLAGTNSIFGGNGSTTDTYVFSYTPGTNADNFSPAAGSLLGSTTGFGTETATGIVGGGSGLYNVYWTSPSTTNVNVAGARMTITGDGAPIIIDPLDGNDGGTGADADPGPAFVGGGNNAWYLLGTVQLTAGNTYTVTQESNVASFVSMRAHAVMWEAIPEPSSGLLALLGGLGFAARRRR